MATQTTQLTVVENSAPAEYTTAQIELIKKTVAAGCSNDELALFLEVCRGSGLNPFMKQIYAIKRSDRMTVQTGIDGYRLGAARTGALAGIDDATYDTEEAEHPTWASVTVWRFVQGQRVPFTAKARWREYAALNKDGHPTAMWAKMPYLMLAKCAEALALRKAFPAELSGVYTAEEMEQADNPPTPYVEASAPTPREWNAAKDSDVVKGLRALRFLHNSEQHDYLESLKARYADERIEWSKDNVMAHLRAEWKQQADAEKRAASTQPVALDGVDMGAPGN